MKKDLKIIKPENASIRDTMLQKSKELIINDNKFLINGVWSYIDEARMVVGSGMTIDKDNFKELGLNIDRSSDNNIKNIYTLERLDSSRYFEKCRGCDLMY